MSFKLKGPTYQVEDKTTVSFRIKLDTLEQFEEQCTQAGISLSEGLRQLIEYSLKGK